MGVALLCRASSALRISTFVEFPRDGLQIVLPAKVIQPITIHAEKPRGVRLHLFGLFECFCQPALLEALNFLVQIYPTRRQMKAILRISPCRLPNITGQ